MAKQEVAVFLSEKDLSCLIWALKPALTEKAKVEFRDGTLDSGRWDDLRSTKALMAKLETAEKKFTKPEDISLENTIICCFHRQDLEAIASIVYDTYQGKSEDYVEKEHQHYLRCLVDKLYGILKHGF